MSGKARDVFFNVNRPQERILYPFYASCLLILAFLVALAYLMYEHPLFRDTMDSQAFVTANHLGGAKAIILILGITFVIILFALIYWAYNISNQILGPYERIVHELDMILNGKGRRLLHVRKNDEMFAELVERINALITERHEDRFEIIDKLFNN